MVSFAYFSLRLLFPCLACWGIGAACRALAGAMAAARQGTRPFVLRVIFLFAGFHMSLTGSSPPTTLDAEHHATNEGMASPSHGDEAHICLSGLPWLVFQ